ncbi:unnamed protein product [Cuscuta campestris]|uniref:Uncharacterized protein n=1 Tax=Cuscuta campestris TaxID=132261 RepID=A0A484N9T4_9ASTE|nr:unnamed protein product [Cuscuta campestris]
MRANFLYILGCVSQELEWLMSASGPSNTVLETVVHYSRMFMVQLLVMVPSQPTSLQTAEEMALLAYVESRIKAF